MNRREFIAALGSALGISLITTTRFPFTSDDSAPLTYDVSDIEWARLGSSGQEAVREFLRSHGINPETTYRVEFNRSPMHRATTVQVYGYHRESGMSYTHLACDGSIAPCRTHFEVTL